MMLNSINNNTGPRSEKPNYKPPTTENRPSAKARWDFLWCNVYFRGQQTGTPDENGCMFAEQPTRPQPRQSTRRQRKVNTIDDDYDSNEDNTFRLEVRSVNGNKSKHPQFKVQIRGTWTSMMADSGSSINILDEKNFKKIKKRLALQPTSTRVNPYKSDTPLKMLGKFEVDITTEKAITSQGTIYVTEGAGGSLLSWRASQNLELISVASPLSSTDQRPEITRLVHEYSDLFTGLRKLKDFQVKLHIDDNVQPSAQPHRCIPFHVCKQLEEQLERDERNGVIEKVEDPTAWVSPVVVAPKPEQPGKIRMCVD
ncbi:hypothetical protein QZH41_003680 [Actinostola sp. cb2023]|nr:hypothetical protein QZH41_003680 [Actinostola sp. cb2023]